MTHSEDRAHEALNEARVELQAALEQGDVNDAEAAQIAVMLGMAWSFLRVGKCAVAYEIADYAAGFCSECPAIGSLRAAIESELEVTA